METLKEKEVPHTIRNIKGKDLTPDLLRRINITPEQVITITITTKAEIAEDNDYDIENVGDSIIQSLEEIKTYKEGKLKFPPPL